MKASEAKVGKRVEFGYKGLRLVGRITWMTYDGMLNVWAPVNPAEPDKCVNYTVMARSCKLLPEAN